MIVTSESSVCAFKPESRPSCATDFQSCQSTDLCNVQLQISSNTPAHMQSYRLHGTICKPPTIELLNVAQQMVAQPSCNKYFTSASSTAKPHKQWLHCLDTLQMQSVSACRLLLGSQLQAQRAQYGSVEENIIGYEI